MRPGVVSAVGVLGIGWLVAPLVSGPFLDLVQQRLHYLCSFVRMGADDAGDWSCQDGIGYLGIGVASTLVLGVVGVAALAVLVSSPVLGPGTGRRLLLALSPAPFGWAWVSTAYAATQAQPVTDAWVEALGLATVPLALQIAGAVLAAFLPRRGRRAALLTSAAAAIAIALLQPGVAWAAFPVVALLGAASLAPWGMRPSRTGPAVRSDAT